MAFKNYFDSDLISGNSMPKGNPVLEAAYNIAGILEHQHDRQLKLGTPNVPAQVRADRPSLFSSGFQQVNELPEDIQGGGANIDQASAALLSAGKPVYYKPGVTGTLGSDRLEMRLNKFLPLIATPGKDSEQIQKEVQILLSEPDDAKFVNAVSIGPKKGDQKIVFTKEMSDVWGNLGYNFAEGSVMSKSDYDNLSEMVTLKLRKLREDRIAQGEPTKQAIAKERLNIAKEKAAQEKLSTSFKDLANNLLTGTTTQATPASSISVVNPDAAAIQYLQSIKANITPANIKWAKGKIK